MKQENGYYIWNKGERVALSDHFGTQEFTCHCDFDNCKEQRIAEELITRLEWLREASNGPLSINSGFRCAEYQKKLVDEGVNTVVAKKSTHELGDAADVASSPLQPLQLLDLAKFKFYSVGIGRNFLHLDLRPLHPDGTPRRWKYY